VRRPLRLAAAVLASLSASAAPPEPRDEAVRVCVSTREEPAVWTAAVVRAGATDTVVPTPAGDVPWRLHFQAAGIYAEGRPWFARDTMLRLPRRGSTGRGSPLVWMENNDFSWFRQEVVILPEDFEGTRMVRMTEHDGVPFFVENPAGETTFYFVPVRPGCVFQPSIPNVWY
jgi:hypothetical protein